MSAAPWPCVIACFSLVAAPAPVVEIEEDVYSFESANNGAGPMWCGGSTCLVRSGDTVFASGLETLKEVKPLSNCRWFLRQRDSDGWKPRYVDSDGRTREPSPIVILPAGVCVSANPTLAPGQAGGGPARPELCLFPIKDGNRAPEVFLPEWQGRPPFTEHSYRSFAADGGTGDLILLQNIGYTHAEWAFRDRSGAWAARGQLKWPWGAEYDTPQPIRVCYPNVAIHKGAVHFCGVSDIIEPYAKWRAFKKELTGREWDYDFRRLFYTWCPDIRSGRFKDWIEIASRDKTCGWISPGDLWVAPDGTAHLLWTERALDERLREKFFPEARQSYSMHYATVRNGQVSDRRTLAEAHEGGEAPSAARFHITPENRLFVCYYVGGRDAAGKGVSENRVLEILPDGTKTTPVTIPFKQPFTSYFTATPRGGSLPSRTLDMLGNRAGQPNIISYARVRFE